MQYEDDIKQYLRVFYVVYKLDRFTTLIKKSIINWTSNKYRVWKKQDLFKNNLFCKVVNYKETLFSKLADIWLKDVERCKQEKKEL